MPFGLANGVGPHRVSWLFAVSNCAEGSHSPGIGTRASDGAGEVTTVYQAL